MLHRLGWALAGAVALVVVLALARATIAGPLDPPGPVGSTMRTLDELVPSWGKTLSSTGGCSSQRFQCVMSNEAVLDRETGLVWMRTPDQETITHELAVFRCQSTIHAGRYGWRLPTLVELYSLTDDSGDDNLPDGHPFILNDSFAFHTSTTAPDDDQLMMGLFLFGGFIEEFQEDRAGREGFGAKSWCVRGGQALDDDPLYAEQPAWSRTLSSEGGCFSARFECVMNQTAVLDRETGLVWQRTPSSVEEDWAAAYNRCLRETTGGRTGWRLPTIAELGSLIDQSIAAPGGMLPPGHPFISATSGYWSSTEAITNTGNAYAWKLTNGIVLRGFVEFGKGNSVESSAWCVRGADAGQR